ncbi:hypothetical protein CLM85_24915 [Streptomyces albidoflavus]|nr:hypothetical protein CLM85_24915 [Streptomyces albidoflavus]
MPGGGRIEPVTSSGRARLGQRITFAVQDETHSWLDGNGPRRLARAPRRRPRGPAARPGQAPNARHTPADSAARRTAPQDVRAAARGPREEPCAPGDGHGGAAASYEEKGGEVSSRGDTRSPRSGRGPYGPSATGASRCRSRPGVDHGGGPWSTGCPGARPGHPARWVPVDDRASHARTA